MPFTLTMPKLSPTMEGGTIVKWRVKEGDLVKAGDVLFEVSTDKATVEHAALDGGYLRKILVKEGGEAVINQPVAIFTEKKEESIEGYVPEGVQTTPVPTIAAAAPKKEETAPMPAPKKPSAELSQPAFAPEAPLSNYEFPAPTTPFQGRIAATPLARKLAKEKGIDISTVKGSGPGHRVTSHDLDLGQPDLPVTFGREEKPTMAPGTFEEEAMTPMRKVIAQRLQASKTFVPHFYVSLQIRADRLHDAREQLKNSGHKVTINDFIIRATALALREHPHVNSGFDSSKQALIRFKTIDIALAVNIPDGLITPIIRHADFKNLGQISVESKALAEKARNNKLDRSEYMGGSFTISNMGMLGITEFVAVINPPQAAILAVGSIEDRPVVETIADEGRVVVAGKTMQLTLSGDHRVIDGAEGARFLKTLQKFLENPAMLLI
ncbi:MAG: pyruvate dehydrogenase complex dihydrolipoamide acetyltransferase [Verrucomicrobia bacterium]|nr:pyruvate dehydrogenase complex dihydrolipoamide acetyltransferase [Verrucomicrobiota bacterium]